MTARLSLIALFLIVHLLIAVWDIVAVSMGRHEDTVSKIILEWSQLHPVVVLVVGFVLGHVFWPQYLQPAVK